jgi:hypothetical protein
MRNIENEVKPLQKKFDGFLCMTKCDCKRIQQAEDLRGIKRIDNMLKYFLKRNKKEACEMTAGQLFLY